MRISAAAHPQSPQGDVMHSEDGYVPNTAPQLSKPGLSLEQVQRRQQTSQLPILLPQGASNYIVNTLWSLRCKLLLLELAREFFCCLGTILLVFWHIQLIRSLRLRTHMDFPSQFQCENYVCHFS